jgi:hypothetical protein
MAVEIFVLVGILHAHVTVVCLSTSGGQPVVMKLMERVMDVQELPNWP